MDLFLMFVAVFAVMFSSLAGVITIWKKAGTIIERNLSLLVSFAAGVFLVIALELSREVFKQTNASTALLYITLGILIIWSLFRVLPQFHHHHDPRHENGAHTHFDARRILLADAIHNVGDGLLLAVAFITDTTLGIITAAGVFLHEIVQEIAEFFVLREGGYSVRKALLVNFLISGTIFLGAVLGITLLGSFEHIEPILLGITAGSFFLVVAYDLIPHSVRSASKKKRMPAHAALFLLGVLLMTGVTLLAPHEQERNEDFLNGIAVEKIKPHYTD